jgi:hypothetical protein
MLLSAGSVLGVGEERDEASVVGDRASARALVDLLSHRAEARAHDGAVEPVLHEDVEHPIRFAS